MAFLMLKRQISMTIMDRSSKKTKNLSKLWIEILSSMLSKNITTTVEAIEMLENFHQLDKRQLVREYIETKAAEYVYMLFMGEMKEVEEMYENHAKKTKPPMPPSHPKYSGYAIWGLSLLNRIEISKKVICKL